MCIIGCLLQKVQPTLAGHDTLIYIARCAGPNCCQRRMPLATIRAWHAHPQRSLFSLSCNFSARLDRHVASREQQGRSFPRSRCASSSMADEGKCICCEKEIFEVQDYTTLICHAVGQATSHTTLAHDKCWEKFARAARRSSGPLLGASHPSLLPQRLATLPGPTPREAAPTEPSLPRLSRLPQASLAAPPPPSLPHPLAPPHAMMVAPAPLSSGPTPLLPRAPSQSRRRRASFVDAAPRTAHSHSSAPSPAATTCCSTSTFRCARRRTPLDPRVPPRPGRPTA